MAPLQFFILLISSFLVFILSFVSGYFVLNIIRGRRQDFLFNVGYSALLGYGILGYFTLLLSFFGEINRSVIFILSLMVFLLGRKSLFYLYENLRKIIKNIKRQAALNNILLGILLFLIIAASFFAYQPPYRGDEVAFHLPAAKIIAEGGIFGEKWNQLIDPSFIAFPMLLQTLYALSFVIYNFTLAHLIHYQIFLVMLLVIYVFLRDRFSKTHGLVGCILIFGIFELVVNATVACADAAMVAFDIAGFLIFIDWFFSNKKSSLILSALLLGLGASVKYLSLFSLAVMGLFFLIKVVFISKKRVWEISKTGLAFLTIFFITSGFWYLKNLIFYNNPFHPIVFNLFNSDAPSYFSGKIATVNFDFYPPYPRTLWGFLTLPFRVFSEPHYYPILLGFIILPVWVFLRKMDLIKRNKKIIILFVSYVFIFFAMWYFAGIQIRRYSMDGQVVLMILAGIFIATGLLKILEKIRLVWILVLIGFLLIPLFLAVAKYEDNYFLEYGKLQIGFLLGIKSKYDFYVFQNCGEEFVAADYINKNLKNEKIINNLCLDEGNFFLNKDNRFVSLWLLFIDKDKDPWPQISEHLKENNINYLFLGIEGKERTYSWKTGACSPDLEGYKNEILPLENLIKEHSELIFSKKGVELYKINTNL